MERANRGHPQSCRRLFRGKAQRRPIRASLRASRHLQGGPAIIQGIPRPLDGRIDAAGPVHLRHGNAKAARVSKCRCKDLCRRAQQDQLRAQVDRAEVHQGAAGHWAGDGGAGGDPVDADPQSRSTGHPRGRRAQSGESRSRIGEPPTVAAGHGDSEYQRGRPGGGRHTDGADGGGGDIHGPVGDHRSPYLIQT